MLSVGKIGLWEACLLGYDLCLRHPGLPRLQRGGTVRTVTTRAGFLNACAFNNLGN